MKITWESARVDTFAVVVHALDDGTLTSTTSTAALLQQHIFEKLIN